MFKIWTYTTTSIILTLKYSLPNSDLESTAYLDTGCRITHVNKNKFLKQMPSEKINTMPTSLKVREIIALKLKFLMFAVLYYTSLIGLMLDSWCTPCSNAKST